MYRGEPHYRVIVKSSGNVSDPHTLDEVKQRLLNHPDGTFEVLECRELKFHIDRKIVFTANVG